MMLGYFMVILSSKSLSVAVNSEILRELCYKRTCHDHTHTHAHTHTHNTSLLIIRTTFMYFVPYYSIHIQN